MQSFAFLRPTSLAETLALMSEHAGHCRVVAGGTDLVPALREGRLQDVSVLIDVRRRPELQGIKRTEHGLWLGGGTTFTAIVQSAEVSSAWSLLVEASRQVGGKQIRNLATLAGNVANASPAADSIPALLCLEARVSLLSTRGTREVQLENYLEEKTTGQNPLNELLLGFLLPYPRAKTQARFVKVARRQALAIARLSLAIAGHAEDGVIDWVHVAPGAVLPYPQRLTKVEQFLTGCRLSAEICRAAAELAAKEILAQSGKRPSFDYKLPVLKELVKEMLEELRERV
ncbi:CO dehydrogenase flavoprotein C-terminal domain [Acididesulfobacillus acetoxydans]|uniref:CO dehydrogenase flavoprotein C-terminal domain n=1 Tax=Acididesulfobacillus acetoxydans TaxID=1561005 RepID=A0A8S0WN48_9FIRM|nr:FAD binding domain-containing protein [Acididesulfobacillus acetoxydans]CAA7601034.1 CO dehydrogenase flavoprotein C-terminal domain [Acididesulfobacillus acetoxydans]CEJ06908.1 CO dehydrogenase flavoprotein, C-terminal [Acididesulfobacillus acetoxydans]